MGQLICQWIIFAMFTLMSASGIAGVLNDFPPLKEWTNREASQMVGALMVWGAAAAVLVGAGTFSRIVGL